MLPSTRGLYGFGTSTPWSESDASPVYPSPSRRSRGHRHRRLHTLCVAQKPGCAQNHCWRTTWFRRPAGQRCASWCSAGFRHAVLRVAHWPSLWSTLSSRGGPTLLVFQPP